MISFFLYGGGFRSLVDEDMEQLNCYGFVLLGEGLNECILSARLPLKMWIMSAHQTKAILTILSRGDVAKFRFDESANASERLKTKLEEIIALHSQNGEAVLDNSVVQALHDTASNFKQALGLELGRAPIFYVTPKGVNDTRRLITDASVAYEGYLDKLPKDTIEDTKQAGRCLAFSLPTAVGFHIVRATEAVVRKYAVAHGVDLKRKDGENKNFGDLVIEIGKSKNPPTQAIIGQLMLLKDIHRNPLMHPEVTLDIPEANALWSFCISLIQIMTSDMERRLSGKTST